MKKGTKIFLAVVVLLLIGYIYGDEESTSSDSESKADESAENASPDEGGATRNVLNKTTDLDILSVLLHCPYLDAADISVHHESDRNKMPDKISSALKNEPVIVKREDGGLFGKDYYAATSHRSGICYYGSVRDNKPNGFGVISYGQVDLNDPSSVKNIRYAGDFKDGFYNGYGVEFGEESLNYSAISLIQAGLLDQSYETIADVYLETFVTYDGDWKKGEKTGEGNLFTMKTFQYNTAQDGYWGGICYPDIEVSDFNDGMADGNTRVYESGVLTYDGQAKDNARHGTGTTYYKNGQKKYDGEWKYGLYNGKGKLYDENGSLIYSGKWKDGDYQS